MNYIYKNILSLMMLLCILIPISSYAIDIDVVCNKVVVAGDLNQPPYTLLDSSTNKLSGIGIDIARYIFNELDVPVVAVGYEEYSQIIQGLRDGEVDLVVNTYDNSSISHDAKILHPAYLIDPITVAIGRAEQTKIFNWQSLVKFNGMHIPSLLLDDDTHDLIFNSLNLNVYNSMQHILELVKKDPIAYALSSEIQLTYLINNARLNSELSLLQPFFATGNVYMAFAKSSPCQHFAVYIQKRLQDYKNNGTVEKIIKQYIN